MRLKHLTFILVLATLLISCKKSESISSNRINGSWEIKKIREMNGDGTLKSERDFYSDRFKGYLHFTNNHEYHIEYKMISIEERMVNYRNQSLIKFENNKIISLDQQSYINKEYTYSFRNDNLVLSYLNNSQVNLEIILIKSVLNLNQDLNLEK